MAEPPSRTTCERSEKREQINNLAAHGCLEIGLRQERMEEQSAGRGHFIHCVNFSPNLRRGDKGCWKLGSALGTTASLGTHHGGKKGKAMRRKDEEEKGTELGTRMARERGFSVPVPAREGG